MAEIIKKKCENCGYEMEDGDISGYMYIAKDRYFDFMYAYPEEMPVTDVNDTYICENCVIMEAHSIDVPDNVAIPKAWLLNLIKETDEK